MSESGTLVNGESRVRGRLLDDDGTNCWISVDGDSPTSRAFAKRDGWTWVPDAPPLPPEPPVGGVVRDKRGLVWERTSDAAKSWTARGGAWAEWVYLVEKCGPLSPVCSDPSHEVAVEAVEWLRRYRARVHEIGRTDFVARFDAARGAS